MTDFAITRHPAIYFVHLYFSVIDLVRAVRMELVSSDVVVRMSRICCVKFGKSIFLVARNVAKIMNFKCPGNRYPGIRIITRTPQEFSEWSWWSADDFSGLRFSDENVAEMLIFG